MPKVTRPFSVYIGGALTDVPAGTDFDLDKVSKETAQQLKDQGHFSTVAQENDSVVDMSRVTSIDDALAMKSEPQAPAAPAAETTAPAAETTVVTGEEAKVPEANGDQAPAAPAAAPAAPVASAAVKPAGKK
jgi:hypothetical protein